MKETFMKNQEKHCSFCGVSQDKAELLISGKTACICTECVELCRDIIFEHNVTKIAKKVYEDMQKEKIKEIPNE